MRTFEYKDNKWYEIIPCEPTLEQLEILNSTDETPESIDAKSLVLKSITKRRYTSGLLKNALDSIYNSVKPDVDFEFIDCVLTTENNSDFYGLLNYRIDEELHQVRIPNE